MTKETNKRKQIGSPYIRSWCEFPNNFHDSFLIHYPSILKFKIKREIKIKTYRLIQKTGQTYF